VTPAAGAWDSLETDPAMEPDSDWPNATTEHQQRATKIETRYIGLRNDGARMAVIVIQ